MCEYANAKMCEWKMRIKYEWLIKLKLLPKADS